MEVDLAGGAAGDDLLDAFGAPRYLIVLDDELVIGRQELRIDGAIEAMQRVPLGWIDRITFKRRVPNLLVFYVRHNNDSERVNV